MSEPQSEVAASNSYRLLWAGFMSIMAAGMGFSIRGGILGQWAEQFGFTMTELGTITGGGLTGAGIVILATSLIADRLGYGKLMILAFLFHFASAVITLAAPAAFAAGGKAGAYSCLYWGMFTFALGNGVCEAVVNPLTAALFPKNKTHFLNILHAGWPAGLVVGGLASAFMAAKLDQSGTIVAKAVDWKIQMSLFLIPVMVYGAMLIGQRFPKSEAVAAGASMGQMLATLVAPLMLVLLLLHAMVGYVELGTDSWISKITGSIMDSPAAGLRLFVYTSLLMFALRFVAGPIVHRISPLGLLFMSSVLGAIGLTLLGNAATVMGCVVAVTVYAFGKTFLWPTMLAVASERFPRGGAVAIGALGGAGMLSAGLLGGPAIGFKQDYFASKTLRAEAPDAYQRYKADNENEFLGFKTVGLDGAKVGVLEDNGKDLARDEALLQKENRTDPHVSRLAGWWETAKDSAMQDKQPVIQAGIRGGKEALLLTAYVPMGMAVLYLLLIVCFKASGGYRAIHIDSPEALGTGES